MNDIARERFKGWTPDIESSLFSEIASGKSIKEACQPGGMPSYDVVYRRMASDEAFAAKMALARTAQQEHEADACVEMADAATPEDWQCVKLRIWARQWRAAKLAPKKYGDKQQVELSVETSIAEVVERARKRVSGDLARRQELAAGHEEERDAAKKAK